MPNASTPELVANEQIDIDAAGGIANLANKRNEVADHNRGNFTQYGLKP